MIACLTFVLIALIYNLVEDKDVYGEALSFVAAVIIVAVNVGLRSVVSKISDME